MARPRSPIFKEEKAQGPIRNAKQTITVDCMSLVYAEYFGCKTKLSYNGQRTEVIFGFLNTLINLFTAFGTKRFVFAFDSKLSLRKKRYPWYKRRDTNLKDDGDKKDKLVEYEAIMSQVSLLRSYVLPTMGFPNIFMQRGIEADDLIASVVMNNPRPHVVVSGDEDLYQLLDYCDMYLHRKKVVFNRAALLKQHRVTPSQWIDVKKLGGCSSDKIPGIPGVGVKTAASFLLGELNAGKKLDAIQSDMAKEEPESVYKRNGYLVTLPLPETRKVLVDFENQGLSMEGFQEVCDAFAFRLLDRSNRDQWKRLLT